MLIFGNRSSKILFDPIKPRIRIQRNVIKCHSICLICVGVCQESLDLFAGWKSLFILKFLILFYFCFFFNFFFLFLILITDAVPEAIYKELPPRLQKEVQVDRTRAPSLSANWAEENIIETAARKWNKNKAKFVRKKKIIKRKKSTSYSSQIPPREQWNKAIWRGNLLLERVYVCRDILIVVFSRLA